MFKAKWRTLKGELSLRYAFTFTKHLQSARHHIKCFTWIILFPSSQQFCDVSVRIISAAQVEEKGLRVDKWPADDHVPGELRARIPSQAACLQVCAPHLAHSSHSFMARKADEQGQGKEGHGAPLLRTRCWATCVPALSMPYRWGRTNFFLLISWVYYFLGLLF